MGHPDLIQNQVKRTNGPRRMQRAAGMTDTEHDDTATFRLPARLQVALLVLMMVPIFINALMALHFGMFLSFA